MIFVSFMSSRNGAKADAVKHNLKPVHVYDIRKYEGKGNFIVDSESYETMHMFACFGLRWFLYRGQVANVCGFGSDAVAKWNKQYNDNLTL